MPDNSPTNEPAHRPLRQRGAAASIARLGLRVLAITTVVFAVVVAGAIAILLSGPTEIGFVRERVVETLRSSLGEGYIVTSGKAVIDVDPLLGGLVILIDDIVVEDSARSVVARVPSTRFVVNTIALLGLRLEINELELSGADFSLVRLEDGSVRLGNAFSTLVERAPDDLVAPVASMRPGLAGEAPGTARQPAESGGFPGLYAALQILDRGIEPPINAAIRAGFERLMLVDGTIEIWEPAFNRQRRFPNAELDISVDLETARVSVNFSTIGFGGRWAAELDRLPDADSSGRTVTAVFSQLTIADLVPGLSGDGAVTTDIPLYGRANIHFGADGAVDDASARLDLGAGVFAFNHGRESILLDEATLKLRWDIPNDTVIVDPSSFYFGDTRGSISGRIQTLGEGADRRHVFDLAAPNTTLAPRDSDQRPLIARQINIAGSVVPAERMLHIDELSIHTPEGWISLVASLGFGGRSPSLALAATTSPMSINTFKQMWVPLFAPGSRRWVLANVKEGQITSATLEAAVPGGVLWTGERPRLPEDMVRLNVELEDVTYKTFGEAPPMSKVNATVVLAGSTFGVDLTAGQIETPSGIVNLDAGAFAIPDLSQRPANGVIEFELSGSAQALGEIADSKPASVLSKRDVTPGDLSGEGDVKVSARIPLRAGLTIADVDWTIAINTKGLSSAAPIEGRLVSAANLAITVTPGEVGIYGHAKIDGVDADVSMALATDGKARDPGARLVRLILDDDARKKMGIGLENMLSGSITALVADGVDGGQRYELDLARARMTIPGIGWTKGIGVPAHLSFEIVPLEDGHAVRNLVFQGDGFGFRGAAELNSSYSLVSADIDHLSLREGDAIALKVARNASGFAITARGESLNLQGLISQVKERYEQSGGFPNLVLDARIDKLIGFNQEVISGAALRVISVGGETQKISFQGTMGSSGISLDYVVAPEGTSIFGTARDAGRLMRFTDLYTKISGGVVTLNGNGVGAGPLAGTFEVAKFDVVNEPAMQRIAFGNGAESGGATKAQFNPTRVTFDRLTVQFLRDKKSLVVDEAVLRGAEIGATFAGRYDVASTNIVITGTYLPAYGFNNLFSQIPILGLALGGGAQEGLIGITFKVEGPVAGPDIYFNPLSAVAPGIFRKIFEFQ
jgi:hypothetical protein